MRHVITAAVLGMLALGFALDRSGAADDDKDWVTVKGQIVFGDDVLPVPVEAKVDKDDKHCLQKGKIYEEDWVIDKETKGVRGVFVWFGAAFGKDNKLQKLAVHPSLAEPKETAVFVDQPFCKYEPRAAILREGQSLIIKNSSPINHDLAWTGQPGRNDDGQTTIASGKEHKLESLKMQFFPMKLSDPTHPWMKGWVHIGDNPYAAVTDAKGNFEIKRVPVGACRIFIWHEMANYRDYEPREFNGMKVSIPGKTLTLKGGMVNDLGKLDIKMPVAKK
jgi:hypothetical protein